MKDSNSAINSATKSDFPSNACGRDKKTTCTRVASKAVKNGLKEAVPSKKEFVAYATEKNYQCYGFNPSELFDKLEGNHWKNPEGKSYKTWKGALRGWFAVYKEKAEIEKRRQKALSKRKARQEKQKAKWQARINAWLEAHKGFFYAFTDGSCVYNGAKGPGGSAYVILDNDGKLIKEAKVGKPSTTSNRMEMLAIISAINCLPEHSKVLVYSDSKYAINIFKGRWTAKLNTDLLAKYNEVAKRMDKIELCWVKGHNGNKWNEYVDKLATGETAKILKAQNDFRYTSQESFGNELEEMGFKKANSLDSRITTYIKCGGQIFDRDNSRTEVSIDYYGAKIVYELNEERKLRKLISWHDANHSAKHAFEEMFNQKYLTVR